MKGHAAETVLPKSITQEKDITCEGMCARLSSYWNLPSDALQRIEAPERQQEEAYPLVSSVELEVARAAGWGQTALSPQTPQFKIHDRSPHVPS
eukprot:1525953-Amphidinium_carterae.2